MPVGYSATHTGSARDDPGCDLLTSTARLTEHLTLCRSGASIQLLRVSVSGAQNERQVGTGDVCMWYSVAGMSPRLFYLQGWLAFALL